jgi:hypothetical protein
MQVAVPWYFVQVVLGLPEPMEFVQTSLQVVSKGTDVNDDITLTSLHGNVTHTTTLLSTED